MSFRQYGGINYAARNNIVKNNYTNANNLSVMTKVGQPSSIINVESGLYGIAGDITFQQLGVPKYGITFSDGSFQNSALTSTDSYWVEYLPPTSPATIYYTGRAIVGADPYVTGGNIGTDVRLAVNGGTAIHGNLYVANGDSSNSGVIYVTDNSNNTLSKATLKIIADRNNQANYIQSGVNNTNNFVADLYFTDIYASNIWMVIKKDGKVGIGTASPNKILDVNGDALINGLTVGRGTGNVLSNTVVGSNALNLNTTGNNNTAIGNSALFTNSTGSGNMAVGTESLFFNEIGSDNMGIGYGSLYSNTSGSNNTAVGAISLIGNITGSNNTANGHNALLNNTSGSTNTAVGSDAGKNNTTTSNNTYIGYNADCATNNLSKSTAIGYNSTITASNQIMMGTSSETVYIPGKLTVVFDASINGVTVGKGSGNVSSNTALGVDALKANTTGNNNTAVGYASMRNNVASSQNTSLGINALFKQQNSGKSDGNGGWLNNLGDNTAIGFSALYWNNGSGQDSSGNLSGAWNTAVGLNALYFNTTGYYNTAIGLQAGVYFNSSEPNGGGPRTANKCTFLGAESRSTYSDPSQSTAIGYNSVITANNQIMMGTNKETVNIPGVIKLYSYAISGVTTFNVTEHYYNFYTVDANAGDAVTITLPDPSGNNIGMFLTFRRINTNTHSIFLKINSGNYMVEYDKYVNGVNQIQMTYSPSVITSTFFSNGSKWFCTSWVVAY